MFKISGTFLLFSCITLSLGVASIAVSASSANWLFSNNNDKELAKSHNLLRFNTSDCQTETKMTAELKEITYLACRNIPYTKSPVIVQYQTMNIFIPIDYIQSGKMNETRAANAPIYMPNFADYHLAAEAGDTLTGGTHTDIIYKALSDGYVTVSPALRGLNASDFKNNIVDAVIDYKAAVRWLRHNKDLLPAGNTERIFAAGNGTGAALAIILGASGNDSTYNDLLIKAGAADERDDIYGVIAYNPVTDLSHADMAYEWLFGDETRYYEKDITPFIKAAKKEKLTVVQNSQTDKTDPNKNIDQTVTTENTKQIPLINGYARLTNESGWEITPEAKKWIQVLKSGYPVYINSLHLHDKKGQALDLNKDGSGTFSDYISKLLVASAVRAAAEGTDISAVKWLTFNSYGVPTNADLGKYAHEITRLKPVPAFDHIDLSSLENSAFGIEKNDPKHFTHFSYNTDPEAAAESTQVRLMNPNVFIISGIDRPAYYWRIRQSTDDGSFPINAAAVLSLLLEARELNVDFSLSWNKGHSDNYDTDALFKWMSEVAHKK